MMEEFGKKLFTKELKEKGRYLAQCEVETLDMFIRGDVCGYVVDDDESCWGFYGIKDCMAEAKMVVDCMVKEAKENHFDKVKTWIKNKVPFEYRTTLSTALTVE